MAGSPYPAVPAGDGSSVLVDGSRTGGRLAVVVRRLTPGVGTPTRRLAHAGLTYLVVEGDVELEVNGATQTLGPLSAVHVPATVEHRYRALARALLVVLAAPAGAEQLLLHEDRLARDDPALLLALGQEHHVEFCSHLIP